MNGAVNGEKRERQRETDWYRERNREGDRKSDIARDNETIAISRHGHTQQGKGAKESHGTHTDTQDQTYSPQCFPDG